MCFKSIKYCFFFQVEYILLKFDDENKKVQVSLRGEECLSKLNEKELADPKGNIINCNLKLLFIY